MKTFFTNKYVQSVLLFVLIIGGYVAYQNVMLYVQAPQINSAPQETAPVLEATETETTMEAMGNMETSETAEEVEIDKYKGIHIMGDGTVMLGTGEVLNDAAVTEEGMIELSDGTTIEPVMDLR